MAEGADEEEGETCYVVEDEGWDTARMKGQLGD